MKSQNEKSIRIYQWLFIICTVLVIPFTISGKTIEPVLLPRFLALTILLFLLIFYLSVQHSANKIRSDYQLLQRRIFAVLLLYVLITALSLFKAINIAEGIFEVSKTLLFAIFVFVASIIFFSNDKLVDYLSKALSLTAAVLAFIGVCQYFGLAFSRIPGNFIVYSTMANKNQFATALALTLPFLFYGFFFFKDSWKLVNIVALVLSAFIIAIIRARSSWIALFIAIACLLLFARKFSKNLNFSKNVKSSFKKRVYQLIIGAVLLFSFSLGIDAIYTSSQVEPRPMVPTEKTHKLAEKEITRTSSIQERFGLWSKTIAMIGEYPLTGVGAGNWKIMFPKYGVSGLRAETGEVYFVRPHNDFLWVAAETGIFGFITFMLLFGTIFYYIYKIFFHSKSGKAQFWAMLMGFGILEYLFISAASFPKERMVHPILLFLMFSVILSFYHKHFPIKKKLSPKLIVVINLVLLILLGCSAYVGYMRLDSEVHIKNANRAKKLNHFQEQIAELNKAESFWSNMDPISAPIALYRGLAYVQLKKYDQAFIDFKNAYQVHPYHLAVLSNLAAAYEKIGNLEKSAELFKKVLQISPKMEQAILNLTAVYYEMGDYQKAYETILKCDPDSKNPKVTHYMRVIEQKIESAN